jgi:hypothetical protein
MNSTTFEFECRYETGLCFTDRAVENIAECRSKKVEAMNLVVGAARKEAKKCPFVFGGYVRDRLAKMSRFVSLWWPPLRPG